MGAYGNLSKTELIERLERLEAELARTHGERDREAWELDRRLGKILKACVNEIYLFDAKTLKFILVNSGALENLGYTMEEMEELTPLEIKPEFAPHEFEAHLAPLRSRERERVSFQTTNRRKDGTSYPVEVGIEMTRWGDADIFVAIVLDITESEKTRQQFRAVVESAGNGIIMVDAEGKIVLVNSQAEKYFGYDRPELLGEPIETLIPERAAKGHDKLRAGYAAHPEARPMGAGRHLFGRRKDGREFPVEVGLSPVRTAEGVFILAVIIDITERKRLEGEVVEAGEREKRRIGEDIHDDLCQQLAGIGCMAKVLEKSVAEGEEDGAEMAGKIGRMIGEVQVRAREVARGLVTGSLQTDGLMGALEELASSTEALFEVTCVCSFAENLAFGDPRMELQLYRITQEAISNAVRHGEATRIELALAEAGGRLLLSITDDGRGMPAEGANPEGLGLLTMSHRAEMINGFLRIRSGEGKGTVVEISLTLPAERTSEAGV